MKKNYFTALVFLFVLSAAAVGQVEQAFAQLKGVYQGQVFNSGSLDPVQTSFQIDKNGKPKGTYSITEEGGVERGVLSGFKWEADRVLVCTWKDKYGTGILRILFTSDFSSFRGFWGEDAKSTSFPWSGAKKNP